MMLKRTITIATVSSILVSLNLMIQKVNAQEAEELEVPFEGSVLKQCNFTLNSGGQLRENGNKVTTDSSSGQPAEVTIECNSSNGYIFTVEPPKWDAGTAGRSLPGSPTVTASVDLSGAGNGGKDINTIQAGGAPKSRNLENGETNVSIDLEAKYGDKNNMTDGKYAWTPHPNF